MQRPASWPEVLRSVVGFRGRCVAALAEVRDREWLHYLSQCVGFADAPTS